jgi:hypothetical protein
MPASYTKEMAELMAQGLQLVTQYGEKKAGALTAKQKHMINSLMAQFRTVEKQLEMMEKRHLYDEFNAITNGVEKSAFYRKHRDEILDFEALRRSNHAN